MFWIFVIIFSLIVFTIAAIGYKRTDFFSSKNTFWFGVAAISLTIAIVVFFVIFLLYLEYLDWENIFIMTKDFYCDFGDSPNPNFVYAYDIVEANMKLFEYQTKFERYGIFTIIPERVMSIMPIK